MILIHMTPREIYDNLKGLYISSAMQPTTELFEFLLHHHYPGVPSYDDPKGQYLSLANNKCVTYYTFLYMDMSKIWPILYGNGPNLENENMMYILGIEINGIRPHGGSKIWIGITTSEDGKSVVHVVYGYTKSEVIESLVNRFMYELRVFFISYAKYFEKIKINELEGSIPDWMKCRFYNDNYILLSESPLKNPLIKSLMIIEELVVA